MTDTESPAARRGGPLAGVTIVEVAGLGPGPFCAMMLADMGADVIRVDRPSPTVDGGILGRGKRSVAINLKAPGGLDCLLRVVDHADGLIEGFRPGVAERLGFGPDVCLGRNQRLVYGRATGWGQDGPLHNMAGHDIDYIALSGVLSMVGRRADEPPVVPLNLVGDFGGGGMLLAFGMTCAMLEARGSGRGQMVDAAMVDGSSLLATMFYELLGRGAWSETRGVNSLDGGAPYYDCYGTSDGRWVAVGAVEPQFYAEFIELLGISGTELPSQSDPQAWPQLRQTIAEAIRQRPRDEWAALAADTDTCLAPVLTPTEAPDHPHNRERRNFVEVGGVTQPAPAPRFSRTPAPEPSASPAPGAHSRAILQQFGFDHDDVSRLEQSGAVLVRD